MPVSSSALMRHNPSRDMPRKIFLKGQRLIRIDEMCNYGSKPVIDVTIRVVFFMISIAQDLTQRIL